MCNLPQHQERMDRTRREVLGEKESLSIANALAGLSIPPRGILKFRLIYGRVIEKAEILPYDRRKVITISLVQDDSINYSFKFADRAKLDSLIAKKGSAEEILVVKNGLVTDASIYNAAFLRAGKWFTPKIPLLCGIRRALLLRSSLIVPESIRVEDIYNYERVCLFNAMVDFGEIDLPVKCIYFD